MESGSKSKRREGQDMTSDLPDSIIGHILSFLSTKQAVRTSVLSKRWIHMWTFVTKLSFNDRDSNDSYPSYNNISNKSVSFSKFVNRVLLHLNNATIQEFHLSLPENYDPNYINQWVSTVLNRGVKKINVSSKKERNTLRFPLFECQSLEEIVFKMIIRYSTMKPASFICLPSLTILKLVGIKFTCHSSNELKQLTLSFPLLREYVTHDCVWSDVNRVTIEAPLLESVDFSSNDKPIESLIIKFRSTHITKFSFECPISSQTILLDDRHIPSAKLNIFDFDHCSAEESWIFIRRLLSLFTNAEYLDLCFDTLHEALTSVEHCLDCIPTFQMLAHLKLFCTSDVLLGILLKSPCLETLVVDVYEMQKFALVPDCFISTLKVVKFDDYFCGDGELSFAKFVMENAKMLERISFVFSYCMSDSKVESAKKKLSLIKINSSKAIMDFSTSKSQLASI
ncbi:F-box/LRR-repeat protein At4g14103-like [Vicia villosa]|uniref:F-box/LRR-repeat protein At4g14103-like n=1 Tax=Vicia villosa TaxID=3911 RepID=UPI00273B8FDF|nr:F-box/LRR-repeat protein At4g14103-like [Vicia villosa]